MDDLLDLGEAPAPINQSNPLDDFLSGAVVQTPVVAA